MAAAAVAASFAACCSGSSGSSVYDVSEEKTNGTRLARLLVDGGTHVLKKFLHSIHPPATLQHVLNNNFALLQNLKTRGKIFDGQWQRLFPSSGDPPDSQTFDITLLHLLLREICHLVQPVTGWHNMPADTDDSREANIVRIKCFRNELCHSISTGIPNGEFEDKWNTISHSLVALGLDQQEIDRLKTETIDHDTERRVDEELRKFEPRMQTLEQELQQLKGDMSCIQRGPISEHTATRELPNCLPDEVPDVFGRSQEIQQAVEAVQSGAVSIVVITGGPGFGKTTVANKVAHELAKPEYCRSVLCCSLMSKATLKDIATSMILTCSKSHSQPPENPQHWLLNWSKQQLEKVTFVLDNADDVLESGSRDQFVKMLREMRALSSQNLTFITTTRRRINAPSSDCTIRNIRLTCLSSDEASNLLLSKVHSEETRENLSQTTKMVSLCGCVPLALCIVGSLLSDYKEDRLIRSLEKEPLDVLQDDEISVENAIKTSFDLLSQTEQEALAIMSVFPGSFDSNAAEAVIEAGIKTGAQPIVRILRSLKNRSLLEQPSSCRYQIHQLIQAFAKKMGQTEASRQVLRQVEIVACSHFISRLADNANMYWSKDKCKESVEAFNEDRHNFEFFLQVYVEREENRDQEILDTCETSFDNFLQTCMYLEKCVVPRFYTEILQRLLKTFNSERQPVYRVELLCLLGHETRKEGNQQNHARFLSDKKDPKENERREQETETALEVCREKLGEHPETAATLLFSGIIAKRRKELNEAEQNLTEALELFKKLLGKHLMTAQCLKAIADLYFFLGRGETELDKCLAHYKEATEMFEYLGMGASKEIALTLKNFGSRHMRKGNFSEAMNLLTKANRVAEQELEVDHTWKISIKTALAILHEKMRNPDQAKDVMLEGLLMGKRLDLSIDKMGNKEEIREFINRYPETFPETEFTRNVRTSTGRRQNCGFSGLGRLRQEPHKPMSGFGRRGPSVQSSEREKALEVIPAETQAKNIEFGLGQADSSSPITGSSSQHFARIQDELRTLMLKTKARNEDVLKWIDKNVSAAATKEASFIRALVTVVCEDTMDRGDILQAQPFFEPSYENRENQSVLYPDGGHCKCNIIRLKDRKHLLQRYIGDNTDLELQALYAVQALFVQLDHPPGFIKSYFDSFYDEELVTEETFNVWAVLKKNAAKAWP
ncbi:hypothetical protein OS493_038591 [Desmophyllum pertusum]|uniref:W2 domain-containing protein n=1 Tax=Desmophyllum pertusum TaxID=174260 RepID=A0A9W9YKR6_9CNID|nr:hypothetical protein OS493_038591 [Desmophyllum pertusum]